MQSLWKNPVISHVSKRVKCRATNNYNMHSSLHRNFIHISRFASSSGMQKCNINGVHMTTLDSELPGKPDFMQDDFDSTQELEVLGLHDTIISKQQAPDSRVFNPEYDPHYDPNEEDQIEAGGKKQSAQHRIIKSNVKEDVVIEMEAISSMERLYTWLVLGVSVYCGMLAVRFYFMRDRLNQEREEIKQENIEKKNQQNLADTLAAPST
eukprot:751589_1